MNLRGLGWAASMTVTLTAIGIFASATAAPKPGNAVSGAGGGDHRPHRQSLPLWVYPVSPPRTGAHRGVPPPPPDANRLLHVPGSTRGYTAAYISNLFSVPDWFPDSHPPLPHVVAHGRPKPVPACGYCHLPNGQGRPENESIAGLPEGYILQELSDFKHGLRKSSDPHLGSTRYMIGIAESVSPEDAKAAAAYFSSLRYKPWIRVVETARVPVTRAANLMLVVVPGAGTEPIGDRVIEVSENQALTDRRDPRSGFIAYVPPGSIARGRQLVRTGGHGKTIRCAICHGPDLKGLGNVPSIVGRSPSQMARQLIDIQTGARNGPYTQLMKLPVRQLKMADIVDIVAYLASLHP